VTGRQPTQTRDMWSLFTARLRRALLDAHVMDEIRIADSADSSVTFTATQLIEFLCAVEDALASGVRKNHRAMTCSFRIDD